MTQAVLIVAAHPDDEVLGMGATIARHVRAGDDVSVLWVTEGSTAQYPGEPDMVAIKRTQAQAALQTLGVTRWACAELPDMQLDSLPHIEINRIIETELQRTCARTVYCVHPDLNKDHRAVFESTAVAARARPGSPVSRFYTYGTPSAYEWTPVVDQTFTPTRFVAASQQDLAAKLAAFAHYESETRPWPHPRSTRAITAAAHYWGCVAGVDAAEPFMVMLEVQR